MKLRVVSYKACPFVQRVLMVLHYKKIEYDIEYIDLASPPDWFLDKSPLKKVPILMVGDDVIFESSVINEYIDESYENKMHPESAILKAQNRSWIELGSSISMCTLSLTLLQNEDEFNDKIAELYGYFDQIEKVLVNKPYFNGDKLSLVDVTYAPGFQRLDFIEKIYGPIYDNLRHQCIFDWKNKLLDLDSLKKSAVPDLKDIYYNLLWTRQGYISHFLDEKDYGPRKLQSTY